MTVRKAIEDALAEVKGWTAFTLADEADCSTPNTRDSEGAVMLCNTRDEVVDFIESHIDEIEDVDWFDSVNDDGSISEIADGAPSIYTYTVWKEFTDLGAYNEDPTELGFDGSEMDKAAGICLYIIAERLAYVILLHVREAVENVEDEGQEDD